MPISLKKKRMKTVQPKSLQRWKVSKSLKNLVREGNSGQRLGML